MTSIPNFNSKPSLGLTSAPQRICNRFFFCCLFFVFINSCQTEIKLNNFSHWLKIIYIFSKMSILPFCKKRLKLNYHLWRLWAQRAERWKPHCCCVTVVWVRTIWLWGSFWANTVSLYWSICSFLGKECHSSLFLSWCCSGLVYSENNGGGLPVCSEHAWSPAKDWTRQIQYDHQTAHIFVFESQEGAEIAQVGKHRNRLKNWAGKSRNSGRKTSCESCKIQSVCSSTKANTNSLYCLFAQKKKKWM